MKCFRCEKQIEHPDHTNADYIIADDTLVNELREKIVAVKHNAKTLAMKADEIKEDDYDHVIVESIEAARNDSKTVRVEIKQLPEQVQKTGIICPNCYRETDTVIWGIHKSN